MTTMTPNELAHNGMLLALDLLRRRGELSDEELAMVSSVASHVLLDTCTANAPDIFNLIQQGVSAVQILQIDVDDYLFVMSDPGGLQ